MTPGTDLDAARRRLLLEARSLLHGGDSLGARDLLEAALGESQPGEARAEILWELAGVYLFGLDYRRAVDRSREALGDVPAGSLLQARLMLLMACAELLLDEPRESIAHAHEAAVLAARVGDAEVEAEALAIEARERALLGDPQHVRLVERALELESPSTPAMLRPTDYFAVLHEWADDFDGALAALQRTYSGADVDREETPQTWTLVRISRTLGLMGAWPEALDHAQQADERALDAGQLPNRVFTLGCRAFAEACLGWEESARAAAGEALTIAESVEAPTGRRVAGSALGLLELSLGDAGAAHHALAPFVDEVRELGVGEPGAMRFVPDAVEALVEIGEPAVAAELLGWYEAAARTVGRSSAIALSVRCRGLLAAAAGDVEQAVDLLEEALHRLEDVPLPLERARTLLALGTGQRRARERRAARESLEAAAAAFGELGATLWAERARAEIARIGGRVAAGPELTPNEMQVAQLVAEGLTNKEVAARLFLSPKTVEFHLRNVFRKVGVKSRTELTRRLPEAVDS